MLSRSAPSGQDSGSLSLLESVWKEELGSPSWDRKHYFPGGKNTDPTRSRVQEAVAAPRSLLQPTWGSH